MNENIRFIALIDTLKAQGQVSDYVRLAATLGTNKAGISDIKAGRKKNFYRPVASSEIIIPNSQYRMGHNGGGGDAASRPRAPRKTALISSNLPP